MYKSILIAFCVLMLSIAGCSKEKVEKPNNEELLPVTFSVNTFSYDITPLSGTKKAALQAKNSAGNDLRSVIRTIQYTFFDKDGYKILERETDASMSTFGTIQESLPAGAYTLYVVGTTSQYINAVVNGPAQGLVSISGLSNGDTFLKKIEFEIKKEALNQDLTIERIVGGLDLVILDKIPESIAKISLRVNNVSQYYYLNPQSESSNNAVISKEVVRGTEHWANFTTYFFLANNEDTEAAVTISAYKQDGSLAASKIIENVPLGIKKRTTLKGELFNGSSSANQKFMVTAKDEWRKDGSQIDF